MIPMTTGDFRGVGPFAIETLEGAGETLLARCYPCDPFRSC
jgi:hypothetical protein